MYNNPYIYNPQPSIDRINSQIAELEKLKSQIPQQPIPQPTNLTQNFQLSPSSNGIKYATSIDEVKKEMTLFMTPFFSKDMSVLWIKNPDGSIRSYELNEIIQKDEKDIKIDLLMAEIEELKKGSVKDESTNVTKNDTHDDGTTESKKSSYGKSNSKYDK